MTDMEQSDTRAFLCIFRDAINQAVKSGTGRTTVNALSHLAGKEIGLRRDDETARKRRQRTEKAV